MFFYGFYAGLAMWLGVWVEVIWACGPQETTIGMGEAVSMGHWTTSRNPEKALCGEILDALDVVEHPEGSMCVVCEDLANHYGYRKVHA